MWQLSCCAAHPKTARKTEEFWSLTRRATTRVGLSPSWGEAIQIRSQSRKKSVGIVQVGPVKKLIDRFANEMIGAQYSPNAIVAQASTPISP